MSEQDPPPAPLLSARDLVAGYEGRGLLPALDVDVAPGELWCVFGRNGAGKTTLLRTLLGLLPSVRGGLTRAPGLRVGYVPQRQNVDLAVPARVIDLVRTGLDEGWSFLRPFSGVSDRQRLATAMKRARLSELARMPYRALSEGQKQRALLARALVVDPALLVLDEPTSAMDRSNEDLVWEILLALKERGTSILLITHDVERAAASASHALFVDKDSGTALVGEVDDVLRQPSFIRHYGAVFAVRTTPPTPSEGDTVAPARPGEGA